jgi:hypothetical protein
MTAVTVSVGDDDSASDSDQGRELTERGSFNNNVCVCVVLFSLFNLPRKTRFSRKYNSK